LPLLLLLDHHQAFAMASALFFLDLKGKVW
jgi:hypothetical protein